MIISAHQPYFCPYPGYFAKAMNSDVFVILDSVRFPRGGTWITRNRFKNDQGMFRMGIPVWKKGRGFQRIDEVRICHEGNWKRKHLDSIRTSYAHAPYLEDHLPVLERAFTQDFRLVRDVNVEMIAFVMGYLGITCTTVLQSDLGIREEGTRLLIEICRALGASQFLTFASARKYLDEKLFHEAGVTISYISPPTLIYPQLWGEFAPNLSIFDLLLNCGPKAKVIMEKSYEGKG